MRKKIDLKNLPAERLGAWRRYHYEAVSLANQYGRNSPKDEEAIAKIEREFNRRIGYAEARRW